MASNLNNPDRLERALAELVTDAGAILLRYFGKILNVRQKENPSSVVCDADLAAERCITEGLRKQFPDDSIIAEESGYIPGSSEYTWVIDPLDGTSNFVAGLPWFGVQVGVFRGQTPITAAMFLPVEKILYASRTDGGVLRNGEQVRVSPATKLKDVLCAFGFDPAADTERRRKTIALLMRVSAVVRNTRATNSLVDFCYALDGRLGGCINLNCKIWDIVPLALMMPEAGGLLTDIDGQPLSFDLRQDPCNRVYTVLGAAPTLHSGLLSVIKGTAD